MNTIGTMVENNLHMLEHAAYLHKKLFSKEDLVAYHIASINASPDKIETDEGLVCIKPLEWDSKMFGIPVVRIDYILTNATEINNMVAEKEKLLNAVSIKYPDHYIFSRLDTRNITSIYAFENTGYNLVDGIETFCTSINLYKPYNSLNPQVTFRDVTLDDEKEISEIGHSIFQFDRFHNDTFIANELADEVHSEWLRNSVRGVHANYVVVAEQDKKIVSFATCKLLHLEKLNTTLGIIELVGTRKEYQGQGFGKEITRYALNWFNQQHVAMVQVKTQLANVPAAKTYLESDFKLLNTELTFRTYRPK